MAEARRRADGDLQPAVHRPPFACKCRLLVSVRAVSPLGLAAARCMTEQTAVAHSVSGGLPFADAHGQSVAQIVDPANEQHFEVGSAHVLHGHELHPGAPV